MVSAPPDTKTAAADRTVIEIAAALQAGEYERAAQLAGSVLALGMHHPIVYNARALAFQQKGQFREALAEFSRARGLAPNDPNLLVAIGVCFINAGTRPKPSRPSTPPLRSMRTMLKRTIAKAGRSKCWANGARR